MATKEYEQARKGKRTRNWAFLIYPESAPANWREILERNPIPALVSPLHDQDVWTAYDEQDNPDHKAGTAKKEHWHILLMYSSVKTYEQVMELVEQLGGSTCVKVEDAKAYARYLCHLGSKDKHVYTPDEVEQYGGADYWELIEGTGDKVEAIAEMEEWCEQQGITSYAALSSYARRERRDWYRVLVWNGRHIKDVMQSREWERREQAKAEALGRECCSEQSDVYTLEGE